MLLIIKLDSKGLEESIGEIEFCVDARNRTLFDHSKCKTILLKMS